MRKLVCPKDLALQQPIPQDHLAMNHKFDGDKHCGTPNLTDEEIQRHFLSAANKLLEKKDSVIASGREMQAFLFDTSDLEAEQAQFLEEMQVVSNMVQQAIR